MVGWIQVEVHLDPDTEMLLSEDNKPTKRTSENVGSRSREERRNYGSEGTNRTATPPLRTDTPSMNLKRQSFGLSSHAHSRSTSGNSKAKTAPPPEMIKKTKLERQLVAITYSGDWYRLRIPDHIDIPEGEGKKKGKCDLLEYRRLGIGGSGW